MFKYSIRRFLNILSGGHLLMFYKIFNKEITDVINDREICYDPTTDIGFELFFKGSFEKKEIEICNNYVNDKSIILDIGANIGLHSLYFSRIVKNGLVLAFEPSRETFMLLLQNIKGIGNILPLNIGASDSTKIADFYIASDNAYSGLKDTKRKPIKFSEIVLCTKLDDLVSKLNLDRIDLIKIDVEGFEQYVFYGMDDILNKYHPVVFCEIYQGTNSNENPEQTIKYMLDRGYKAFVFMEDKLVPFGIHSDKYYNYFFIPKDKL
jgi:FkbM family methyltransferase